MEKIMRGLIYTLSVIDCSTFAANALAAGRVGTVHSVYKKTVNILCADQLISLQARNTVASPLSLITNLSEAELFGLGIRPGDTTAFSGRQITVGKHTFCFEGHDRWNPYLSDFDAAMIDMEERIRFCLTRTAGKAGFADLFLDITDRENIDPVKAAASEILHKVTDEYHAGHDNTAVEGLVSLIGLGPGLTPSGDDFLCGLLASSRFCDGFVRRYRDTISGQILRALSSTNDISAAFLRCACSGMFSRPVLDLCRGKDIERCCKGFLSIGHSSGADTLCGMLFGIMIDK